MNITIVAEGTLGTWGFTVCEAVVRPFQAISEELAGMFLKFMEWAEVV
jgi:hypothetical protein